MQIPVRLLQAARPSVAPPMLAAIAASTVVFIATPFLVPAIADEFDVATGSVGWISTAQLAGFVLASWTAGRFLRPSRRVFVVLCLLGVAANAGSVVAPGLITLALTRTASGLSLGLAAWFGWQAAFGDKGRTGDVAVVGPLVGVLATPVIAWLADTWGPDAVFVLLATASAAPLVFYQRVADAVDLPRSRGRNPATGPAKVILVALSLVTFGGSSVFVFAAAIGSESVGVSTTTISIAFTLNAVVGIPAARWTGRRGMAGVWFLGTAILAVLLAATATIWIYVPVLIAWGFVFFMGTPSAFLLLAERSRFPEERAGDAQAVMATGRVFGPLMGGALYSGGTSWALGLAAFGALAVASTLLIVVDRPRYVVSPTT
ncbi:MAG: MFS transporter [Actinomycetota bacterium]